MSDDRKHRFIYDDDAVEFLIFEDKYPVGPLGLGSDSVEYRTEEQAWQQDWVGGGSDEPEEGDTDE